MRRQGSLVTGLPEGVATRRELGQYDHAKGRIRMGTTAPEGTTTSTDPTPAAEQYLEQRTTKDLVHSPCKVCSSHLR